MAEQQVSTNKFSCAKWIVDTNGFASGATHTTIASALTSASSGETIFIRPGTYTENLTLKAGVNLTAFSGDEAIPNVEIVGKITYTATGTASISNIRITTNSDNFISMTGTNVSVLNITGCYLDVADAVGFLINNANATVNVSYCRGGPTGNFAFHTITTCSTVCFEFCTFTTTVATTAATIAAGVLSYKNTHLNHPLSSTASGIIGVIYCEFGTTISNSVAVTTAGTGSNYSFESSVFVTGTGACLSIGSGTTAKIRGCSFSSTNTSPVTGAGTIKYAACNFDTETTTMNVTTQTAELFRPGITLSSHQPCFNAYRSSQVTNVTGDSTAYTVVFNAELFDQDSNFDGTSTFTSPLGGKYYLGCYLTMNGVLVGMTISDFRIITSNRAYATNTGSPGAAIDANANMQVELNTIADMDVSDTATVRVTFYSSTKVADVGGSADIPSSFHGYLLC